MKKLGLNERLIATVACLCLSGTTMLQAQLYYQPNTGPVYYYGGKINLTSAYQSVYCYGHGDKNLCFDGNSSDSFSLTGVTSSSFNLIIDSTLPYNSITEKRITISLYTGGMLMDEYSYAVCNYGRPTTSFLIDELHPNQNYTIKYLVELFALIPTNYCSHSYFSTYGFLYLRTTNTYGRTGNTDDQTDDQHVTIQSLDENKSREEETNFNIYPNPTIDFVNVDVPHGESIEYLEIISLTGGNILMQGNTSPVDISNLSPGLYLVRIRTNTQVHTRRICKL